MCQQTFNHRYETTTVRRILLLPAIISVLGAVIAISVIQVDYTALRDNYDELAGDYDELFVYSEALVEDYNELAGDYDELDGEYDELFVYSEALVEDYNELAGDYDELDGEYDELFVYSEALVEDYNELAGDYDELDGEYDELFVYSEALVEDYNDLYESDSALIEGLLDDNAALLEEYNSRYPITTISGTKVGWEFYDSKGNYYSWSMPIETYENQIPSSREYSLYQSYENPYRISLDGRTISIPNLDGFVKRSFTDVIDSIYDNSRDNSDFVKEVWYVVSQLTVYDEDVRQDSEGRYALETFTRTGGDCEDLVILVADMLMSSSHTKDWGIPVRLHGFEQSTKPAGYEPRHSSCV